MGKSQKTAPRSKIRLTGKAAITSSAVALIFAGSIACTSADTTTQDTNAYRMWTETDGAAGRINLDDVTEAFKETQSASEFERRVNEIFEGDNYVLVKVQQDADAFRLEGWEDLDQDSTINESNDDLLFSIVRYEADQNHVVQGHHANGYYYNSFAYGAGGFLFGYMLGSWNSPGYYSYQTSQNDARLGRSHRDNKYRTGPQYDDQIKKNADYTNRQKTANSAGYTRSKDAVSPNRQQYQSIKKTNGSFRQSTSYTKSSTNIVRGTSSGTSIRKGSISTGSRGFSGGGAAVRIHAQTHRNVLGSKAE